MFAWAVLAVLFGLAPAAAEKRVALVVGNGAYAHVARLANPRNDAELMAQTLRTLGFTLIGDGALVDLDKAGFDTAVQSFGAALHGADVGLFYYAGHGVQVRGANYLVPVGANPVKEADVDFQMLDANLVLRQMEGSGTKLNVVILDSCRNNPFGGRGLRTTGNGLVQMQAPEGTLISYATQPGNVAQDGSDDNSPYTKALAQTILRPGLGIFDAFNEVGLAVKKITGGSQQPWVSSSPIAGSFYFSGAPAASITGNVPQSADPAERAWAVIQNTTSVAILDDFIRQFGNTPYGSMARARLEELKKSQVAIVVPPVAPPTLVQPAVGVFPPGVYPLSPERDRTLKPKDIFKECDQCPEMVVVPSGSFSMGSPASEPQRSSDESPQHQITFARQFAVGKFAITFDEWDACVADGGCNEYRPDDRNWGRGRLPVINVNWNDAKAYVAWLSRKTGKSYRLLSEAEREYVTRAGTMTPFWWGSSISTSQANYDGNYAYNNGSKGEYRQRTMPANSFQANPWGLYQVHGNVWEWTEDCWNSSYTGAPTDGAAWTGGDCTRRVLRGGSRIHSPQDLRSAFRSGYFTDLREPYVGFRLGRTLLPP
jgi:formylglycine-generating enzyme required for sulfatase activity